MKVFDRWTQFKLVFFITRLKDPSKIH